MAVVVTLLGEQDMMNLLRQRWNDTYYAGPVIYRAGLFSNDYHPQREDIITAVVPTAFNGYAGLTPLTHWTLPTLIGDRAVSSADLLSWMKAAGGSDDVVWGYYVVNAAGVLVWAERDPNGPTMMSRTGQIYAVAPRLGVRSTFPLI